MRTPVALDAAALLAEREAGTSISELARKHRVGRDTVRRHLDKALNTAVDGAATRALTLVTALPELADAVVDYLGAPVGDEPSADALVAALASSQVAEAEIFGDTPEAVNASFKAAWHAVTPEGAKVPAVGEQRRLRDLHQRAMIALKKATPKAGPRTRAPKANQTPRLAEALKAKRTQGGKLSEEMKAARRTLSHADLVSWLKAVLADHPETDLHTELEYAYWVSNLKTSTAGFTKAWDEACRS